MAYQYQKINKAHKAKRAWLAEQINSAKKSYDKWPNWMKKAARFEGSD